MQQRQDQCGSGFQQLFGVAQDVLSFVFSSLRAPDRPTSRASAFFISSTSARRKSHSSLLFRSGRNANQTIFYRYSMNQITSPSSTPDAPYYLPLADEVEVFKPRMRRGYQFC